MDEKSTDKKDWKIDIFVMKCNLSCLNTPWHTRNAQFNFQM